MRGEKNAINLANSAMKNVPAYKSFLKAGKFRKKAVKTWEDFSRLPITTKKNYRRKYSSESLLWEEDVPTMLYASSGSSGQPTYWYLGEKSEKRDGKVHEYIFTKVFGIKKSSRTLVIISFTMGLWIAGVYTMLAARFLNAKGYNITTITPGVDKNKIINVFEKVVPTYDTVVLAGYPPFVTDIINLLVKTKFIPKSLKILSAGDKCTEEWREDIRTKLKGKIKKTDLANVYGTSDAAILAHETQLSIFLRSKARENKKLYKDLFGEARILPALFQFDPQDVFIEIVGGELVLTIDGSIPLIRYNILDMGQIIQPTELRKVMKKHKILEQAKRECAGSHDLPLLYVTGRTDVAITLYALNIYPENISSGLGKTTIKKHVSGNYITYTREIRKNKTEKFYIDVELRENHLPPKKTREKIKKSIIDGLLASNLEFAKIHAYLEKDVLPAINFIRKGELIIKKRGVKTIAYIVGKKPRMVE